MAQNDPKQDLINDIFKNKALSNDDLKILKDNIQFQNPLDALSIISDQNLPILYSKLKNATQDEIPYIEDVVNALFKKINQCTFTLVEHFYIFCLEQNVPWINKLILNNLNSLVLEKEVYLTGNINLIICIIKILVEEDTDLSTIAIKLLNNIINKSSSETIIKTFLVPPVVLVIVDLIKNNKDTVKLRSYELIRTLMGKSDAVFEACINLKLATPLFGYLPGCNTMLPGENTEDVLTQAAVLELLSDMFDKPSAPLFLTHLRERGLLAKIQTNLFGKGLLPNPETGGNQEAMADIKRLKLDDPSVNMETEEQRYDSQKFFILPGILKFLGHLLHNFPSSIDQLTDVVNGVLVEMSRFVNDPKAPLNSDPHASVCLMTCLDFLACVAQASSTKTALNDLDLFPSALKLLTQLIMGESGNELIRGRALELAAILLGPPTTLADFGQEVDESKKRVEIEKDAKITERWYAMLQWFAAGNQAATFTNPQLIKDERFTDRLLVIARSPFAPERRAVYDLWHAIVKSLPWGPARLLLVGTHPTLTYLLSRDTKPPMPSLGKEDKEAKWEILKEVAGQNGFYSRFPGPLAIKIKTFVKEGPYYTENVAQSQIAQTQSHF